MVLLIYEWLREALPNATFLRLAAYLSFRSIMAALTSLFFMFLASRCSWAICTGSSWWTWSATRA